MTDQNHLDLIKKEITIWNAWREKYPDIQPDLSEADLSEAHLEGANLSKAHLERADLFRAQLREANLIEASLDEANLNSACLEEANLTMAQLKRANLIGAQLKEASLLQTQLKAADLSNAYMEGAHLIRAKLKSAKLIGAHLEGANLSEAHLEGADLIETHLEGTILKGIHLDGAHLENVTIGNASKVGPWLADVHWGSCDLAGIKWSQVEMLGEEYNARQRERDGKAKDKSTKLNEYEVAVRANRQLSVILQSQGLNEYAAHFAYRAQILERVVLRQQRKFGRYLFSIFLDLLAGYGYKPERSLYWYVGINLGFALAYFALGQLSLWPPDAFVYSLTSFHGRGFFPGFKNRLSLHDPLVILAAIEAVVGLVIEISFIATFTKRYFGR